MMNSELALFGGDKVIVDPLVRYNPIGPEELEAASQVIKSGCLSPFLGAWVTDGEFGGFFGGQKVQEFEGLIKDIYKVSHAVTVNSATSGLVAAVGASGIEPGDEVIVSPWTMSASAMAILWWNAIPVFADIEDQTFNLDPASVEKNITSSTKAIMVPDIFGHPAELDSLVAIARKNNLIVIEDCSQSPTALYKDRFAGTIGHIGILSLNYHKHIHTGEGGICLTDDAVLAERMQLIRNHAEAVVGDKGVTDLRNMMGLNFRLGEIEAAIGIEQYKKLDKILGHRVRQVTRLNEGLVDLKGLRTPITKDDCTHVFYGYPLILDVNQLECPRKKICRALVAEGVPIGEGYANIHMLPLFQKKIAYGKRGFPWTSDVYSGQVQYGKGICPIAEDLHDRTMMGLNISGYEYSMDQIDLIVQAFHKVWNNLDRLR